LFVLHVRAAYAAASGGLLSFGLNQKKVSKEKFKSGVLAFALAHARIRPTITLSRFAAFTALEVVKRPGVD
jgi:hypothetical protein